MKITEKDIERQAKFVRQSKIDLQAAELAYRTLKVRFVIQEEEGGWTHVVQAVDKLDELDELTGSSVCFKDPAKI